VRVALASMAFTLLLGVLVALPSFGIDTSLPALTAMGAALGVTPEQVGLMMSLLCSASPSRRFFMDRLPIDTVASPSWCLPVLSSLSLPSVARLLDRCQPS